MQITSQGNGPYGMTMGPNGTMTVTNGNISGTLTAPPGSKVNNFTIVPEGNTSYGNTSYAYPPPTITYSLEPGNNPDCSNCYFQTFTIHEVLMSTRAINTAAIRRHIENI